MFDNFFIDLPSLEEHDLDFEEVGELMDRGLIRRNDEERKYLELQSFNEDGEMKEFLRLTFKEHFTKIFLYLRMLTHIKTYLSIQYVLRACQGIKFLIAGTELWPKMHEDVCKI